MFQNIAIRKSDIFWQFVWKSVKFLKFKWQFSGGSGNIHVWSNWEQWDSHFTQPHGYLWQRQLLGWSVVISWWLSLDLGVISCTDKNWQTFYFRTLLNHLFAGHTRDLRFRLQVGQTRPDWWHQNGQIMWDFLMSVSVHFDSVRQMYWELLLASKKKCTENWSKNSYLSHQVVIWPNLSRNLTSLWQKVYTVIVFVKCDMWKCRYRNYNLMRRKCVKCWIWSTVATWLHVCVSLLIDTTDN